LKEGGLTYKEAGVDIEAADEFVEGIEHLVKKTLGPRVIHQKLGFGGLFSLDHDAKLFAKNYRHPVLVASTDGVGTKLKLAFEAKSYRSVGIDLVAMSANDVVVQGAEPLFFLDYLATSRLDKNALREVIAGIADGCYEAGCALLGGETAEMPDFYPAGEFDMAGFCVGVAERERLILGKRIEPGDLVIGLASNGVHSNGFSLVRTILKKMHLGINSQIKELGRSVKEEFLKPTRIYVRAILSTLSGYRVKKVVKGIAHITGGGLYGNIPRILPEGCQVRIKKGAWPIPPVFEFLRNAGPVKEEEMYTVFNMGIGMVMIVSPYYAGAIMRKLRRLGEEAFLIGRVRKGERAVIIDT